MRHCERKYGLTFHCSQWQSSASAKVVSSGRKIEPTICRQQEARPPGNSPINHDQSNTGIQQPWQAATVEVLPIFQRGHAAADNQGDLPAGVEAGRQRVQFPRGRQPHRGLRLQADLPPLRHPLLRLLRGLLRERAGHPRPDPGVRRDPGQVLRERLRAGPHLPRGLGAPHPLGTGNGGHGAPDEHVGHPRPDRGPEQAGQAGGGTLGGPRSSCERCKEYEHSSAD